MRRLGPFVRLQRGSVMVLVAAAMFPLAGMMSFVIDVSRTGPTRPRWPAGWNTGRSASRTAIRAT